MERLTNKKEADAQRKSYERRLEQGYPRSIPEERLLKLAAYEDTGLTPEEIAYVCDTLVKAADVVEELLGKPNGKVTRNKGGDECCMSNTIEYKGYIGSVEFSEADGIFFGRVLGIPSLISYEGATEKELVDDFHGAVDDYLTFCEEIRRKNDG